MEEALESGIHCCHAPTMCLARGIHFPIYLYPTALRPQWGQGGSAAEQTTVTQCDGHTVETAVSALLPAHGGWKGNEEWAKEGMNGWTVG